MLRFRLLPFLLLAWLLPPLAGTCVRAQETGRQPARASRAAPPAVSAPFGRRFPRPADFDESPCNVPHFSPARQAASPRRGPESSNCRVQVRDLAETLGKDVGTSPFHMVSTHRYRSPGAVTVWGASLTDAYRFLVDGERFEALDRFPLNQFPTSITWNLTSRDDGRVIVPDASGYRIPGKGKRSNQPSWLVLRDDERGTGDPASPIYLEDILEFPERRLRELLGPPADATYARATAATGPTPTYTGEMATTVSFLRGEERYTYLVIVNRELTEIVAGGLIGTGLKSNEMPAEPAGAGGTAFYVPLGESLVKMVYDQRTNTVRRHWQAKLPVRFRTGSTPTLMNTSDGKRWVCLIDSKCVVTSVTNGLISCNDDTRPSQLIAVERDARPGTRPRILTTPLPDWLRTVENSPAASGDLIAVANYSGYLPNGLLVPPGGTVEATNLAAWAVSPDAVADFATGIVVLQYDPQGGNFRTAWADADRQVSCIPTISGGSNMVYGLGAEEESGDYFLYGWHLRGDARHRGGDLRLRVRLGRAPFRATRRDLRGNLVIPRGDYKYRKGELFDAGNQILLLDDGSLIISGGRSLVRVREIRG